MDEQHVTVIEQLDVFVTQASGMISGPYFLIPLLLGVGIFLMIGLRFLPWRKVFPAFVVMWSGRKVKAGLPGELSPFKALMTAMAATVGTGNIVGVATAIMMGGPGAVFWMWVTAAFGMSTKYCEAVLAVKYREVTADGSYVGGPMYYIKNGLGKNWKWLAVAFSIFGMATSFGSGNMTQAHAITSNIRNLVGGDLSPWAVSIPLLIVASVVLVGGVKRIGNVAGTLVPTMALSYIVGGLVILGLNIDRVPAAFALIFDGAFNGHAAVGGFVGSTLAMTIRLGVARGLYSNEAGLGSAPIAHATAIVKHPVRQGLLGMLSPFLDTIIVCTISALVILVSDHWTDSCVNDGGATLTAMAFSTALPGNFGLWLVTISLVLFAFTTILGWCVYGERCCTYLFGHKSALPFRVIFILMVPLGAMAELTFIWHLSDLFNGLMALPNLIALVLLSPVVFALTKEFFSNGKGMASDD